MTRVLCPNTYNLPMSQPAFCTIFWNFFGFIYVIWALSERNLRDWVRFKPLVKDLGMDLLFDHPAYTPHDFGSYDLCCRRWTSWWSIKASLTCLHLSSYFWPQPLWLTERVCLETAFMTSLSATSGLSNNLVLRTQFTPFLWCPAAA